MAATRALSERVTVTMPAELVAGIDRYARNRSGFIAEAVRHELKRRRRLRPGGKPCQRLIPICWTPTLAWPSAGVPSRAGRNSNQRFPLIAVVPVTGTPASGALYPGLSPGPSGLSKPSTALVDQLRCINKQRIRRRYGCVSQAEIEAIDAGLCLFLGLEPREA